MSALSIWLSTVFGIVIYIVLKMTCQKVNKKRLKDAPKLLSSQDEKIKKEASVILDKYCEGINSDSTYRDQVQALSSVVKTNAVLTVDDLLIENAHKLFIVHRECGAKYEGGLGVRITVQWNLFGGCVANLGDNAQREWLRGVFNRGELGCFALTEKGAGVLSGLIVETTCQWTPKGYILHSPTVKSHKTWISQGMTAKWCVVIARLILKDNTDKGPHTFIVDLDSENVIKTDMVSKTDFNGLDNADLHFENCLIPLNSLLAKVSYVNENGEYILRNRDVPYKFYIVAQRLLSGRICIAGASIQQLQIVLDDVIKYCDNREIPSGKDRYMKLSELPVIRDEIVAIQDCLYVYKYFTILNEKNFMNAKDGVISNDLVDNIACGKTQIVEYCINKILELKLKVGSYCLQSNSCFGSQNDILYVYRFAEGDSSILKQKMARDCLKAISKNKWRLIGLLFNTVSASMSVFGMNGIAKLQYTLDLNLLKLAISMIGVPKSQYMERWFESYKRVETIANLKANLLIYNAVYPKLKDTKQLHSFKLNICDQL